MYACNTKDQVIGSTLLKMGYTGSDFFRKSQLITARAKLKALLVTSVQFNHAHCEHIE